MAWPNGTRLKTFASGGSFLPADANAIEDRMLQLAGYRGKSIIATEEARTNTAYGLLTTPDQVSSIVLPTDGLLCVAFQAEWKDSVASAGRAAIFLGSTQLQIADHDTAGPTAQEAVGPGTINTYRPLSSGVEGLRGSTAGSAYTGDVTTGQVVGVRDVYGSDTGIGNMGITHIFAAAGTYDVSVRFKASSGSVTAKNRKLWVWTEAFA